MTALPDPLSADQHAIAAALRHLKEEVLFAFGAEGDDCIQKLVALEAGLPGRQADIFRAFHAGMTAGPTLASWPGDAALRPAYEIGRKAMGLNEQRRRDGGMNVGPLDMPKVQLLLERAAKALAARITTS